MTCLDHAANTGWGQTPALFSPAQNERPGLYSGVAPPARGVAGCPAPALLILWLPRLVLFVRESLDEAPPQLGSTRLPVTIRRPPRRPQRTLTLARQLPSLLPSPVSGTVLLSLFLIPSRMWPSGFSLKAWRKSGADVDSCPPIWTVEDQWLQVKGRAGEVGAGLRTDGSSWLPVGPQAPGLSPRLRTQQPLGAPSPFLVKGLVLRGHGLPSPLPLAQLPPRLAL